MRSSHCFLRLLCASRCGGGGGGGGSVKGIFQNAQVHSMWWWWYLYTLRKSSSTTCSLSLCFYYAAKLCAGSADVAVGECVDGGGRYQHIAQSPNNTFLEYNRRGVFFFVSFLFRTRARMCLRKHIINFLSFFAPQKIIKKQKFTKGKIA